MPGGTRCVAAMSSDTVPVLMVLQALVDVCGPEVQRSLPIQDLYRQDGVSHLSLKSGELITRFRVPIPSSGTHVTYRKWAMRKSIDFPLVSVAVRLDFSDEGGLAGGAVATGVLGPKPRLVSLEGMAGAEPGASLADEVAGLVVKRCKPLPNVPYDPEYRRLRLGVEARRAVVALCAERQREAAESAGKD